MRLKRLTITNFRGISHLDLTLSDAQTTVLVGINGAGKSSVLDAIFIALWDEVPKRQFQPEDIRTGQSVVRIEASLQGSSISGEHIAQEVEVKATMPDPRGALQIDSKRPFPGEDICLSYYPVERMVPFKRPTAPVGDASASEEEDGLDRAISVDYASFFTWYEEREDLENERIREQPTHRDPELEAIRRAVETLLPGFSNLRVRRARTRQGARPGRSRLVVSKDDQPLELGQLSHGERELLAMAGDIAKGLVLYGRKSVEPHLRTGIVLIDEIDLHLHPRWQREVIPRLESAFPNVQFIVTTHSPQVLSGLHPDSIIILDKFTRVAETPPTYGRDTNAILTDIMGVEERPHFAVERLHAIAGLMDAERWSDARNALDTLAKDLGEHDAEIVRLRTMIDVLASPDEGG